MNFYCIKNAYWAQVEGAGLNFRFGYTCFGIAPNASYWRKPVLQQPMMYRLFGKWSFGFNYHSGQRGQWYRFNFQLGPLKIYYLTPNGYKDKNTGFCVEYGGIKRVKKLI